MESKVFTKIVIEAAIRLVVIAMLIVWCLRILDPFILPVLWGTIIAVAIYPIYQKLENVLGGRVKIAATIYTLVALALLITPTVFISNSIIDTSVTVTQEYQSGKLVIPTPSEKVAEWPLIGEKTYKFWHGAATNLEKTINAYLPQVKELAGGMLSTVAGLGGTIVQFIISIIISGVFVANAQAAYKIVISLISRLTRQLMPMGPLRESLSRLQTVDFVINNGCEKKLEVTMLLKAQLCKRVDGEKATLADEIKVNACAAIGYPQRFFDTLKNQQFRLEKAVGFADHHAFVAADFNQFGKEIPLLMTEKDAVKCTHFAQPNWWYLPISAQLPETFKKQLLNKIKEQKC